MIRKDFIKAVQLAQSPDFEPIPYLSEEMAVFADCANDSKRRVVNLRQVASLVRGHCATFAGTWDSSEMAQLEEMSKRFDLVEAA